jgi:hypothetical protein
VKQGGVLSPILFTIYIDELLERLKCSKVGCYIGNIFMGALSYADDIALLAPTVGALYSMLDIAKQYGNEFEVLFNVKKYQLLHFNNSNNYIDGIEYDGIYIKNSDSGVYLGHPIYVNNYNKNINCGIDSLVISFNCISRFFSKAQINVKYKLFKSYCMSLYGSVLWDFTSQEINNVITQWRKCIRKLLNISNLTHCRYLPHIVEDFPIELQLFKRVLKFLVKIFKSYNLCVKTCGNLIMHGSNSVTCRNLNHISCILGINRYQITEPNFNYMFFVKKYNVNSIDENIYHIKDLLYLRDNNYSKFSYTEISELINFFCTN